MKPGCAQVGGGPVHFLEQVHEHALRHCDLREIDEVIAEADIATAQMLGQIAVATMRQPVPDKQPGAAAAAVIVEARLALRTCARALLGTLAIERARVRPGSLRLQIGSKRKAEEDGGIKTVELVPPD